MTIYEKYEAITRALIRAGRTITTMESCTCGTAASLLTDTEGASAVMKGAFITYSNEAKIRMGVDADIIETYGVYSPQTAAAMARAAAQAYGADLALGITGSFGNVDPANPDSVPGQVHFAVYDRGQVETFLLRGVSAPSRREAKLLVADAVADRLLERISVWSV